MTARAEPNKRSSTLTTRGTPLGGSTRNPVRGKDKKRRRPTVRCGGPPHFHTSLLRCPSRSARRRVPRRKRRRGLVLDHAGRVARHRHDLDRGRQGDGDVQRNGGAASLARHHELDDRVDEDLAPEAERVTGLHSLRDEDGEIRRHEHAAGERHLQARRRPEPGQDRKGHAEALQRAAGRFELDDHRRARVDSHDDRARPERLLHLLRRSRGNVWRSA